MNNNDQIVWCDIPVKDLDRAIKFYGAILDEPISKESHGDMSFGLLPHAHDGVGGCLVVAKDNQPSLNGPLIYINCVNRLDAAIAAVSANGGKVLEPKHQIGPYGSRAVVIDSEGNRIALHSK